MRDFSINLPSWAVREGYRLEGGLGTYDELYLWKGFNLIKRWSYTERIPNIFELEEFINAVEGKEVK